ncbi:hypothetical protein HHL16_04345 [Pseudoflavitalea sp. G-6-1-2]|uniref:hypothetical protein n=1 Tax=Pseudoflavitalea sp. G-6-1-2 TaxID=2728841 RepID=UPI00146AD477|nr:hypothetical protein [Pseudoflavitalea sp. G-6-1-2]NML20089.1 hypothetical protein [Pseudoflavitalea sp. G-6-1-2]
MNTDVQNCIQYFQSLQNYFWQWDGDVIEWTTGKTICYKMELEQLLDEFSGNEAPPLSAILLTIDACKGSLGANEFGVIESIAKNFGGQANDMPQVLTRFYDLISNLPKDLHTGNGRKLLLHHIFKKATLSSKVPVSFAMAKDMLRSGRWQKVIVNSGAPVSFLDTRWHFNYFHEALRRTPTTPMLEQLLRTGLAEQPAAADISLPEISALPLLQQLAENPELSALSRLAERLIPVINVPMHVHGSGQLPLGGISDITNKGSYDKLLLSELAHDDVTLMARLVNGEALYFRREEPPDKPTHNRIILIDVTLKMWGIPRLYAIASALAFAHHCKGPDIVSAYMLEGESSAEANLHTMSGVASAMSKLHHALHCGASLQQIIESITRKGETEIVFITDQQSWTNAAFMLHFSKVKESLNYIITVSRSGEIEFRESILGKTKKLGGAKLDLADILKSPEKAKSLKSENTAGGLPLFYSQRPKPLLFPKNLKGKTLRQLFVPDVGLIAVNSFGHVLLIRKESSGCVELISQVHAGECAIVHEGNTVHVLVCKKKDRFLKLYSVHLLDYQLIEKNLSDEMPDAHAVLANKYQFYIRTAHTVFWLNPQNMEVSQEGVKPRGIAEARYYDKNTLRFNSQPAEILKLTTAAYSVMFKTKNIFIDPVLRLVFGNNTLQASESVPRIRFWQNQTEVTPSALLAVESGTQPRFGNNKKSIGSVRYWKDGSKVVIDPKGFIHLISSNPQLAEVTITYVSGFNTACWSSDGRFSGNAYFFAEGTETVDPVWFYKNYIDPFIQHILEHHETTTKKQ